MEDGSWREGKSAECPGVTSLEQRVPDVTFSREDLTCASAGSLFQEVEIRILLSSGARVRVPMRSAHPLQFPACRGHLGHHFILAGMSPPSWEQRSLLEPQVWWPPARLAGPEELRRDRVLRRSTEGAPSRGAHPSPARWKKEMGSAAVPSPMGPSPSSGSAGVSIRMAVLVPRHRVSF